MARQSAVLQQALYVYTGFVVLWLWSLAVHIFGQWLPLRLSDQLGVAGNYLSLALLILVWMERLKYPLTSVPLDAHHLAGGEEAANLVTNLAAAKGREVDALAGRIQAFIDEQQPHLNTQLTLERFAVLLELPPRQVSQAINRCFNQNFHEYINRFRLEEAKNRLRDPRHLGCTVVEIAQQAGFNSKATFNRLFKQQVGVTPSVYRQEFNLETSTEVSRFVAPPASAHLAASQDLHNLS